MATDTSHGGAERHAVQIGIGLSILEGNLTIPAAARAVVLFAHGSGSSRLSPRNNFVANLLHEGGLATLLIDLLTPEEEAIDLRTGHLRFNIDLLADRLVIATDWLRDNPLTRPFAIGYFGASTGGGAALVAAARRPDLVGAVVSRGGRPDLAGAALPEVKAPTMLIVGGNDEAVIGVNQRALEQLVVSRRLEIVAGATHLFEEHGALTQVAMLARAWFARHLAPERERAVGS
jgi:dienelactone hydrolase